MPRGRALQERTQGVFLRGVLFRWVYFQKDTCWQCFSEGLHERKRRIQERFYVSAGSRKPQIQSVPMQKEAVAQKNQVRRTRHEQHVQHTNSAQQAPSMQNVHHATLPSSYARRRKKRAARMALAALGVVVAAVFATGIMTHSSEDGTLDQREACSSAAFAVEDVPFSADEVARQSFFYALGNDTHTIAQAFAGIPASQEVTAFSLAGGAGDEADSDVAVNSDEVAYYEGEAEGINASNEESTTTEFQAATEEEVALSQDQLDALNNALSAIHAQAAFTLIDAQTGKGVQLNSGTPIYAASSGKAWFSFYLAQRANEGDISLDDALFFTETDYPIDSEIWGSVACAGSLIENTLVYSDNGAYSSLRERYEGGYTQWLADLEIDPVVRADQSWFPFLTPAASVQMWADMYVYMNSDAENASWFASLLRRTETSFLRDAIAGAVENGQNVSVSNKAGWDSSRYYASYSPYESALCDSGIVEIDGHVYFASFITSMEENDANISALENLMRVAFETVQQL